jgi:hypothetical protein
MNPPFIQGQERIRLFESTYHNIEKVRRLVFLVRERVKLRVIIKGLLTYEGLKWSSDYGLFTKKDLEWLHGLSNDSIECYLNSQTIRPGN